MNILAEKLGIDPLEIRLKNLLKEGDKDVTGQTTHSIGARECLEKVTEFLGKKAESSNTWKTGKGFALCNKYTMPRTSSVVLEKVCDDGIIELRHSAYEMGQGAHTILAQMAAEEFGVPMDKIKQIATDTAVTPYDFATVSSRTTFHVGNAVLLACQDAKKQLFKLAAPKLDARPEDLEIRDGVIFLKSDPNFPFNTETVSIHSRRPPQRRSLRSQRLLKAPCCP